MVGSVCARTYACLVDQLRPTVVTPSAQPPGKGTVLACAPVESTPILPPQNILIIFSFPPPLPSSSPPRTVVQQARRVRTLGSQHRQEDRSEPVQEEVRRRVSKSSITQSSLLARPTSASHTPLPQPPSPCPSFVFGAKVDPPSRLAYAYFRSKKKENELFVLSPTSDE